MVRNVRIKGTGICLPARKVPSSELDAQLGMEPGEVERYSGIATRYFVDGETGPVVGTRAAEQALRNAGMAAEELDCIIGACVSLHQPVPHVSCLVHQELGLAASGVATFDVKAVCMGFFVALDLASAAIEAGRYDNVLIVTPEIISPFLNWDQRHSALLLGDMATAVVVGRSQDGQTSRIIASDMKTFSDGAHLAEVRGGGLMMPAYDYTPELHADYLFDMNGKQIIEMLLSHGRDFMKDLLDKSGMTPADIDVLIPHQASATAMKVMDVMFPFAHGKTINVLRDYGNVAAATIPLSLHEGITSGGISRGDTVLIAGGGGGFNLGGIVLEY